MYRQVLQKMMEPLLITKLNDKRQRRRKIKMEKEGEGRTVSKKQQQKCI